MNDKDLNKGIVNQNDIKMSSQKIICVILH